LSFDRAIELVQASTELRLNAPPIQIRHFQSEGEPMRLDASDSWVPTEGGSDDPNNTTDIESTIDFLRSQLELHRTAYRAIKDFLRKAAVNRSDDQRER
jgi:hypothetical protein